MAKTCILKENVNAFRSAIAKGEIKMGDLFNLSTEELTKKLKPYAGANTKDIVLLFEQKRILKNKVLGMKNAVSKIGELGKYSPAKKAEIKKALDEFKAKQKERIFSPKENENFYNALADKMLGTHVTRAEAKNLSTLQNNAEKLRIKADKAPEKSKERMDFGAAEALLKVYKDDLMTGNKDLVGILKEFGRNTKEAFKEDIPTATAKLVIQTVKGISDLAISLVASWDASFMGRQGLFTLYTNPSKWLPMAVNSLKDFGRTIATKGGGKKVELAQLADRFSRKNYMNGDYKTAKIITEFEEAIPTKRQEKIPVLGRIFKAADLSFTGAAERVRMDLFDMYKKQAIKNGVKWDKKQIEDIGTLVNSLTSRGKFGKIGDSPVIKLVFWAPRMLKANWDVLTGHSLGSGLTTAFARKEAAKNLVKIIGSTAMIMKTANAISPGSAETDPRSSNFGKIKVGNTTFSYTAGIGSLAVLASRMITGESKSATTGVVSEFGSGFGDRSRWDALSDFGVGKTTPLVNQILQFAKGRTYQNTKPTGGSFVYGTTVPISLQNAIELKDDASVSAVLGVIVDVFGINANTRPQSGTNWNMNPSKEMKQFKESIGDKKFVEANKEYNDIVGEWIQTLSNNEKYQSLSNDDKRRVLASKRAKIKNEVFRKYRFRSKRQRKSRTPRI